MEVQEVICGVSLIEDIQKFHKWITEKPRGNQYVFESGVISMVVEDVKASYSDVMRMVGKIMISCDSQSFQRHIDNRPVSGLLEDCWKQTPGKIMFGDGLTWCAIISLPQRRIRSSENQSSTTTSRGSQGSSTLYWSRRKERCCGN